MINVSRFNGNIMRRLANASPVGFNFRGSFSLRAASSEPFAGRPKKWLVGAVFFSFLVELDRIVIGQSRIQSPPVWRRLAKGEQISRTRPQVCAH